MHCYELIDTPQGADLIIGGFYLKTIEPDEESRERIAEEADEWSVVEDIEYKTTYLWHDNDEIEGTTRNWHRGLPVVVKDGHYYGSVVSAKEVSSFGMSVNEETAYGLLLIDGTTAGKIHTYFSHCSTEVDTMERGTFTLVRKTDEEQGK